MLKRLKTLFSRRQSNEPMVSDSPLDPPIRLMIGTCPGSRSDTEALARATVDRYFDMPQNAYFYIQRQGGIGYHYEIQEGGSGSAYLPRIVEALMEEHSEVIIPSLSGRQTRVKMKENGMLASSVLSEEDSVLPVTEGIQRSAAMTPIESTGGEWVKFGVMAFSLGLLTLTVASTVHKGVSLSAQGYYEVADQFEPARLVELLTEGFEPPPSVAGDETPLSQWRRIRTLEADGRSYITRLAFEDGRWDIDQEPIELPSIDPADTEEPSDGASPGERASTNNEGDS